MHSIALTAMEAEREVEQSQKARMIAVADDLADRALHIARDDLQPARVMWASYRKESVSPCSPASTLLLGQRPR